ncbi:hypothetical protein CEXT_584291 [Caerostris extrusa]|uniref:Uncharacterized protein n=1 Tax=Caerostris extrusa TaxID=172846 RepID=A0AAV4RV59_CAEEX|nr:hypothetical protein CEXT_584291 [Caerostris extrusa]
MEKHQIVKPSFPNRRQIHSQEGVTFPVASHSSCLIRSPSGRLKSVESLQLYLVLAVSFCTLFLILDKKTVSSVDAERIILFFQTTHLPLLFVIFTFQEE